MKKKFVKAMLLGAMVFAVGTAVTSCKDYDDDINSLQEQIASINKIGADVTTADMNAAINSAVSGLQSKLDDLAGKVASAKDVEALQTAVKELKAAVAKGATKDELSQLTTKLNDEVSKLDASIAKNVGDAKKELQGKIDQLVEKMNAADEAAKATKAELQGKIDQLKKDMEKADGDAKAELQGKIDQLREDMEKAGKDAAEKMTKELADLKSEMQELININAKSIADLTSKIADYENIQNAIAEYEKAKGTYLTSKDIEGFLKEDAVKDIVDARVVEALKSTTGASEAIRKYVEDAISTFYTTQIKNVYLTTDTYNADMVELNKKIEKLVSSEDADYQKIFTRLETLEKYKLSAWEEVINSLGEKNTIEKVEKLTAAMGEITNLQEELSGYVKTATLNDYLKKADLEAEITNYLANKEHTFVKELDDLKAQFEASQNKIQSVSFVQTNVDRTVTFDTWYALKKTVSATTIPNAESWKNISGDSKQKVTFRVSPASAAADFAANYDVTFSADAEISRAAKTDAFEVVGEPVVEDGFVTYTIKSKASKSYAVCMHVTTKEDKVATLGQSDITSDYFAAMVKDRYIFGAQRVAEPAVDTKISFANEKERESVDYKEVGEYILILSDVNGNGTYSESLSGSTFDASLLTTEYSIDENDFFNINNGVVSLKEYGRPSYKGQKIDVKANVVIAGSKNMYGYTVLGTVTAISDIKKAEVIYEKPIELTWSNEDQPIEAKYFPLSTIYNHTDVRLTKREFEALHAESINDAKAKFVVGDQNELTAVVNGKTPAGNYTISVVFVDEEGERKITVKATVIVKEPTIAGLKTNPDLWAGSETAGQVGITPTLIPDDKKPEDITLDLDLKTLFSNYAEIEEAVAKIPGASLNLIVVDQKGNKVTSDSHYSTAGVAFNGVNLRLYKETFDVAKTQLSIKATVTLDGTQKPLQEFKAALSINNISGKWIAGDKALKLDNKAISYEVGKKFQWVDSRNKVMWANGITNAYDENFGDNALNLYGLEAPEFSFCNAKGEVVANDTYLTLVPETGELNFTDDGKVYKFQQDYVTYIKISAKSRWGAIANYKGNDIVKVTIPAEK